LFSVSTISKLSASLLWKIIFPSLQLIPVAFPLLSAFSMTDFTDLFIGSFLIYFMKTRYLGKPFFY
jgi:hypothetical protein